MLISFDKRSDRISLVGTYWSGSFPASELPARLRFYRELRERENPRGAASHSGTTASLEGVMHVLAESHPCSDLQATKKATRLKHGAERYRGQKEIRRGDRSDLPKARGHTLSRQRPGGS